MHHQLNNTLESGKGGICHLSLILIFPCLVPHYVTLPYYMRELIITD